LHNGIFPEATSFDYAFIGGFNFSMAMLIAPLVTILTRKFGKRLPMISGVVMQAVGFISASFAKRIWQLYLSQGLLVGLGVGFIFIPSISILSQWFSIRRSLANGISSAGSGVGGVIFSFATGGMIKHVGLGWSLRITGIITFITTLTAALLLRDQNHIIRPPQLGFDTNLLRQHKVQLLLGWAFISMLGYITLLYSLADFALSIHLSQSQATDIVALLNLGTAVGRPCIGLLSDRYGRIEIAGLFTFTCGVICFVIWLPEDCFGVTVLFAILSGAILGTFWMVSGSLLKCISFR
jgi:MFS family permease